MRQFRVYWNKGNFLKHRLLGFRLAGDLPSWQDKSPGRIRAESQKIAVSRIYCSTVYNTPAGTQVVYR